MNFKLSSYALLAGVACLMASCLGDDDVNVTTYDDVSVTSVTFGKLTFERTTLSKEGKDSTYTQTYDAANYAIHVDQKTRTIFNTDSLPMGTKLDKMFITVSTKNGGVALLKKNGQYNMVSSSDTLDLSSGNDTLTVFSNSGLYKRDYVVKFVVHQEMPDSFTWSKPAVVESVKALTGAKALSCGNGVYVLGSNGTNAVLYKTALSGVNFAECNVGKVLGVATQAVSDGKTIYLYDAAAQAIYSSEDGIAWTTNESAALADVKSIVAADCGKVYGMSADGSIVSADAPFNAWTVESLDITPYQWTTDNALAEAKKYLPATDFASAVLPVRMNKAMHNIVVVGNRNETGDKTAVVWNRIVDHNGAHEEPWAYSAFNETARYSLPKMPSISLASHGDMLIAIGSPYSKIYCSRDNGVNWKQDEAIVLPNGFEATSATMTVDANNIIWLIATDGGKVWTGRLHK